MSIEFVIAIIVIVVGVIVVGFVTSRRRTEEDAVTLSPLEPAPWPIDDGSEARLVPRDPEIRWPSRLGAASGPMDDDARLRLIRDLGFIHANWVVPILAQAYAEETAISHRKSALKGLAACEDPIARETLERARLSSDDSERALAAAVLGATANA
jgi:hypothetical protein